MTFAPYGNIDLNPIFEFLQILNLDQIYSLEFGKFLYRSLNSIIPPSSLGNYFEEDPFVNHHSYGLRSRTNNIPTRLVRRTKFAEKSTQINGLKFWNKIPENIRKSDSTQIFKKSYKKYLIEASAESDDSFFT